ncbi:MAG TPA: gluconeogenesis factor YvcK family protein [Acidimicrobiales bacterium]|jgi:uncharacterized cofD-like protein
MEPTAAGPRVVALGGGHGLAASLRAVRRYASNVTAIVSVADDGGSSGRLREAFGIPAPGDVRRCLVALGDPESLWGRAFEYRFETGELEGHAFGNLVITGLAASTGDFTTALTEAGRLVDAVGRVLPATAGPVVLKADVAGEEVVGQVRVQGACGPKSRVSLVPADAEPPADAVAAILAADQVILGPGSLYTSVLAVTAVPALRAALASRTGGRIYVCNLRPQEPETSGFDVAAHVRALRDHGVDVDMVIHDPSWMSTGTLDMPVIEAAVGRPHGLAHDSERLAAVLRQLADVDPNRLT